MVLRVGILHGERKVCLPGVLDLDGSGDTLAITLWDGNALVFSSSWTGAQTVEQALKTGKITVD